MIAHRRAGINGRHAPRAFVGGEDVVIEVGGRSKGRSQFKGVTATKRMILVHSDSTRGLHRPIHLLGFLEPHGAAGA